MHFNEFTFTFANYWTQKMLILNVNGVMCYFLQFAVQCECMNVSKNIEKRNVEVKFGVEHLFSMAFNYFYIGIRFYMSLKDVLDILLILMLEKFLDWFVFIWGCE